MEEVTLNTGGTTSVWQVNTDDHHVPFLRMGYGLDLVLDIPGEDDEGVRAWMRTGAKIVMCLRLYYIDFVAQGRPPSEWLRAARPCPRYSGRPCTAAGTVSAS